MGLPALSLSGEKPVDGGSSRSLLSWLLRRERRKLKLSGEAAAKRMKVSPSALLRWERGALPPASSYPGIIAFLGREPWPEPRSFREQLVAARRRRGLTAQEAARQLGVDPSTYCRWEGGQRPHRLSDRARCAEFIGAREPSL